MTLQWMLLTEEPPELIPEGVEYPRQCHTPKCQLCGRFTKNLTLVWIGFPPEPDYAVGDCCKEPGMRLRP